VTPQCGDDAPLDGRLLVVVDKDCTFEVEDKVVEE